MKFSAHFVTRFTHRLGVVLAVLLCSALGNAAWADPPGRVGRLGETSGQVWLYTPDAGEWISADRNRPLTSGDRLATDANARAELRIGSTSVRLDGGTELEVLRIDDQAVALQLHNGSVATRLRSPEAAREFELRTAEGRFLANRPGRYRIDRGDNASNLTVWSGEAVYEGPGSALTVYPGQRAEFWLDNGSAQYSITDPQRDNFSAWNNERDRRDDYRPAQRYVSPEMTGAEDLDRYGNWQQVPDYGAVWVPRAVPVGWAPYGAGHWAWVSPWGWTWVDDMPWGFAPFHYGRWMMFNNAWCWVPGTYVRRPVYAPALVGWIGGPHVSLSISVGGSPTPTVGWFPLAPREVYVPTYRVSPGYVQQVNITHVTNITNVTTIINNPQQVVTNIDYRNRRFPHAVTVVPQTVMVNRQPVAPVAAQWRNAAAQQIANQPVQRVVVSAPPVAAPAVTPAVAEARRMQIHANEQPVVRGNATQTLAPSNVVVPPSPPRVNGVIQRAAAEIDSHGTPQQVRRRDMREPERPVAAPAPVVPPHAQATTVMPQAPQAPVSRPQPNAAAQGGPQQVPPPPGRGHAPNTPATQAQIEAVRPVPVARPAAVPAPAAMPPAPPHVAQPANVPPPAPVARPQPEAVRPVPVEPKEKERGQPQQRNQGDPRRPESRVVMPQQQAQAMPQPARTVPPPPQMAAVQQHAHAVMQPPQPQPQAHAASAERPERQAHAGQHDPRERRND
jgi:hypothetical protein